MMSGSASPEQEESNMKEVYLKKSSVVFVRSWRAQSLPPPP